jgi:ABC-2 type transport system permease protein
MTVATLAGPARFRALLASEWTKTRSVRSTYWSLLGAVLAIVGLGLLFCAFYNPAHNFGLDPWRASIHGVILAQIAVGVLGILAMTGEYATGMVRSTFAAVPQRGWVLAAKGVVFAGVVLVITTIASFFTFSLGQVILSRHHAGVSLGDPGVARAVFGVGLYLTVLGLFSLGLGTIIRHTAGAVATLFAVLLVAPLLASALPSPWDTDVAKILPGDAGLTLAGLNLGNASSLSPWVGFAVFCLWTAGLLALAGWLLHTRDV